MRSYLLCYDCEKRSVCKYNDKIKDIKKELDALTNQQIKAKISIECSEFKDNGRAGTSLEMCKDFYNDILNEQERIQNDKRK